MSKEETTPMDERIYLLLVESGPLTINEIEDALDATWSEVIGPLDTLFGREVIGWTSNTSVTIGVKQ